MNLRVLELRGYDIILGVDFNPFTFDFNKLEVIMEVEGKKLTLVRSLESGECRIITRKKLQKLLAKGKYHISQLFSIHAVEMEEMSYTEIRGSEKKK